MQAHFMCLLVSMVTKLSDPHLRPNRRKYCHSGVLSIACNTLLTVSAHMMASVCVQMPKTALFDFARWGMKLSVCRLQEPSSAQEPAIVTRSRWGP